jgi:hypothetical protein
MGNSGGLVVNLEHQWVDWRTVAVEVLIAIAEERSSVTKKQD